MLSLMNTSGALKIDLDSCLKYIGIWNETWLLGLKKKIYRVCGV